MINAIFAADICLVTKPLEVFSSETEWLNASPLFLRMRMYNKTITELGFCMIGWLSQIMQTWGFDKYTLFDGVAYNMC